MLELSLNILDIAINSVTAGATLVSISVVCEINRSVLTVCISDNGGGIDSSVLSCVTDPFFSTKSDRVVGLGLPLLKQRAELTGGMFSVVSEKGSGTIVTAVFNMESVDFVPLGDMESTIISLVVANPNVDFVYEEQNGKGRIFIDTFAIRTHSESLLQMVGYISKCFKDKIVL